MSAPYPTPFTMSLTGAAHLALALTVGEARRTKATR